METPLNEVEDESATIKMIKNEEKVNLPIQPSSRSSSSSSSPRLYLLYGIIILQFLIFLSEMAIDQMVHSMLILADAYHHLFNTFNAILMVVCYKISNQMTVTNTFGWVRAEILGMLTTITFIVALIFSLLIEGALQLLHLHEISGPTNPKVLIIFGVWSLIVNILYVLVINGVVTDKRYKQTTKDERSFSTENCLDKSRTSPTSNTVQQTNHDVEHDKYQQPLDEAPTFPRSTTNSHQQVDSSYLNLNPSLLNEAYHVEFAAIRQDEPSPPPSSSSSACFCQSLIQGILSPCFVIFCSVLITLFQPASNYIDHVEMIDPLIGIITAISLCITFYPQLKNTFLILMQTVPENVNIEQLKKEILEKFQVILNIHEFHIWLLTSNNIVATCHIVLPAQNTQEYCRLFEEIKQFLQVRYGICYITIQPEFLTKTQEKTWSMIRRHSSCLNQCLVKCPCDVQGQCNVCLKKSCCLSDDDDPQQQPDQLQTCEVKDLKIESNMS